MRVVACLEQAHRRNSMELTCLGVGVDQGNSAGPACHLLQVSGTHLLLECPLDVSVLRFFLPPILSPDEILDGKRKRNVDSFGPSTCNKLQNEGVDLNSQKLLEIQSDNGQGSFLRTIDGHLFLDVEPWYKTAELGLLDVSSVDAVLVSNPEGMLGLPFLTGMPEFSGKIYATAVTAKLGQLMMEELVSMHAEFIQTFGHSDSKMPFWLEPATLATLPRNLKRDLVDTDGVGRSNWHRLYSKKDILSCMKKVQCLHYEEEISIFDCLRIKPCSSGLEIGASNWVIFGARCFSYFSASQLTSGHAMSLSLPPHASSDTLLFSDLKSGQGNPVVSKSADFPGQNGLKVPGNRSFSTVSSEAISEGKSLRPLSFSGTEGHGNSFSEMAERIGDCYDNSTDQLSLVSKAALDAVCAGGCVLVTINGIGASLELLEAISQQLCSSNMRHIPIFFISPAAEEILVYANTVPEWLCSARQDKLYAGDALFGHVELLQEKRLHHLCALHASESVNIWKEPCIAFASHWSLRMGPAVPLLYKWRQDRNGLLVMTQIPMNIDMVLSPFRPIAMKILLYTRTGRLRGADVATIIEKLKPKLSLLPATMEDDAQQVCVSKAESLGAVTWFYNTWGVLTIPIPHKVEVDMSEDLACRFHPKQLDSGVAVGHMPMSLRQKDGRWSLGLPANSEIHKGTWSLSTRSDVCWGSVETGDLVKSLEERGLCCDVRAQTKDDAGKRCRCIVVSSPSFARVELRPDSTLIETDDPVVRQLIADAVKSLLHFM